MGNRMDSPKLSIVIPTYNGWDLLARCLASVERYRPAEAETIVVDDGSTDGTAERLTRDWPGVRVIRRKKNGGFCVAANAGWVAAKGEVVELLNNDTEVSAGWAESALAAFADPKVGAVAPLVLKLPFRRMVDSAGDRYYWFGLAKKRGEGRFLSSEFDAPGEVFAASASSAFYRRIAIERAGGFPEHFYAYLDDVDLGFRLRHAGYTCQFVPQSRVYHWVSRSHCHNNWRVTSRVARNSERVFWTNLSTRQLAFSVAPHLAYVVSQLAYKVFKGDLGPNFSGRVAVLAELPALIRARRRARALQEGISL